MIRLHLINIQKSHSQFLILPSCELDLKIPDTAFLSLSPSLLFSHLSVTRSLSSPLPWHRFFAPKHSHTPFSLLVCVSQLSVQFRLSVQQSQLPIKLSSTQLVFFSPDCPTQAARLLFSIFLSCLGGTLCP